MNLIFEKTITFIYSILLPAHILNSFEVVNGVKLFYIVVFLLCLMNLFCIKTLWNDNFIKLMLLTVSLSFIPCFTNNADFPTAYVFTIFSLIGVKLIEKDIFLKMSVVLFPVVVVILLLFANRTYGWRFYGFYNDPNYLALSMLCGVYFGMQMLYNNKRFLYNIVSIMSIIMCCYVIFLTQSRGGILSLIILIIINGVGIYRHNKKVLITLVCFATIGLLVLSIRYFDVLNIVFDRFSGNKLSDVEAASSRLIEIQFALNALISNPIDLIFGTGIGFTNTMSYEYQYFYRIHNSLIALIYENGLVATCIFCLSFYFLLKKVKSNLSNLAFCLSLFLESMTVWVIVYLPFWFGIFLAWKNIMDDKKVISSMEVP